METHKILSGTPRFVPYISVNGYGHIHMQAYQMVLADKLRAWNSSLNSMALRRVAPSRCQSPPDFWCSDPSITADCYNPSGCSAYMGAIYGKPIHIKVIYNSQLPSSRQYVLRYIKPNFMRTAGTTYVKPSQSVIELEPTALAAGAQCSTPQQSCYAEALQVHTHS